MSEVAQQWGSVVATSRIPKTGLCRTVTAQALGSGGPHLLGDTFTGADVLLTTCLTWANFYGLPLAGVLADYRQRLTSREPYRRAAAINPLPA